MNWNEGIEEKDVGAELLKGFVLHERVITGQGKRSTQYILMRPVIENGVITELVEDQETDDANRAPGKKYGLRAKDIDKTMLEEIAPTVQWLTNRSLHKLYSLGESVRRDPRAGLAPWAASVAPAVFGAKQDELPTRCEQMKNIAKSESAISALSALLEGQHLIRRETIVETPQGTVNRMFWRPMLPKGDPLRPGSYQHDIVSARYTEWVNRSHGFQQETINQISTFLRPVPFIAEDPRSGPFYALALDVDVDELAALIGWKPMEKQDDYLEGASDAVFEPLADKCETGDRNMLSLDMRRRENIIAMMNGHMIDPPSTLGPPPRLSEISEAIAHEILATRDFEASKTLIESAMRSALRARSEPTVWDKLWGKLGVRKT